MTKQNREMKNKLAQNGITASVFYVKAGSMKGSWIIYGKGQKWTQELVTKMTELGFTWLDGKPLDMFSGNGGMFQIYAYEKKVT